MYEETFEKVKPNYWEKKLILKYTYSLVLGIKNKYLLDNKIEYIDKLNVSKTK